LSRIARTPTGISGLDEMLNGGFPRGRVVLVVGGPGSGKTVLATQFLVNGIKNYDENGLFVSLDESKTHFYRETMTFGWNLEELEKQRKFTFLDASPIRHIPGEVKIGKLTIGRREFSMISLIEGIKSSAQTLDARRIAVDPIASLVFQYPDIVQRRTAILDLIEALIGTGATSILTLELRATGAASAERSVQLEEYLAHGVIVLQTIQVGRSLVRAVQVEKMRETPIDTQPRPYKIGENGIEVFPRESVF
jgi:KaiC/GvpD/RAD55 family RecA-like ATPase